MGESGRAVLSLMAIVGGAGAFFSVALPQPPNWLAFAATSAVCTSCLGVLAWSLIRRDKAPDFLSGKPGATYERDGFCFKPSLRVENDVCWFDLYFQTRYDEMSQAVVVVHPLRGFFLNRPGLPGLRIELQCPGGGFGWASVPWAVAKKNQGKSRSFDLAADVCYPDGRGTMVRFKGGTPVGAASRVAWKPLLNLTSLVGGPAAFLATFALFRRSRVTVRLPAGVRETLDEEPPVLRRIEWQLGDGGKKPGAAKKSADDPDF